MKCPHCGKETDRHQPNISEHWTKFLAYYPTRGGGQRWPEARLNFVRLVNKQGVSPETLKESARDYGTYCRVGQVAPRFIMQAATFLGKGGGWQEDWLKIAKPFSPFDQARRQLQETS